MHRVHSGSFGITGGGRAPVSGGEHALRQCGGHGGCALRQCGGHGGCALRQLGGHGGAAAVLYDSVAP